MTEHETDGQIADNMAGQPAAILEVCKWFREYLEGLDRSDELIELRDILPTVDLIEKLAQQMVGVQS